MTIQRAWRVLSYRIIVYDVSESLVGLSYRIIVYDHSESFGGWGWVCGLVGGLCCVYVYKNVVLSYIYVVAVSVVVEGYVVVGCLVICPT
jgi:hypothetical protein